MRESFIGLSHLMHVIALANGIPLPLIGFHDFRRQGFFHCNALAGICKINKPAHGQSELAIARNFHRHLISRATDAAGFDLQTRLGVVHGAL